MKIPLLFIAAMITTSLAITPATRAEDAKEVAVLKTSAGEMVVEFWPDVAPKHVANFKKLAKRWILRRHRVSSRDQGTS